MRILVIGGTGFIGPHVVTRLSRSGHEVTVAHRGEHEANLPTEVRHLHDPSLRTTDRPDWSGFRGQFEHLAPEVVLDMAPMIEADAVAAVRLFRGIARRIVAVSSVDVYRAYGRLHRTEPGPPDPAPLTEDSPLREKLYPFRQDPARDTADSRRWMDDYDKILVERAVRSDTALPGTVLRLPMVYGPRDGRRIFSYLKRMVDGRAAILLEAGMAGWRWARGYVENVAAAIALAVTDERAAGRIYNVAEVVTLTEAEWVGRIGEAAGWGGRVVALPRERVPAHLMPTLDTGHHLDVDSGRIRRELGYQEVVPRDEAIRRTVEWERANPPETFDSARLDYAAEDAALAALGHG